MMKEHLTNTQEIHLDISSRQNNNIKNKESFQEKELRWPHRDGFNQLPRKLQQMKQIHMLVLI